MLVSLLMFALSAVADWKSSIPYQPVAKGMVCTFGFIVKVGLRINNMGGYCEHKN